MTGLIKKIYYYLNNLKIRKKFNKYINKFLNSFKIINLKEFTQKVRKLLMKIDIVVEPFQTYKII